VDQSDGYAGGVSSASGGASSGAAASGPLFREVDRGERSRDRDARGAAGGADYSRGGTESPLFPSVSHLADKLLGATAPVSSVAGHAGHAGRRVSTASNTAHVSLNSMYPSHPMRITVAPPTNVPGALFQGRSSR